MINAAVDELKPVIGEVAACSALGACRSGRHRRRRPPKPRTARPRLPPERALSEAERAAVLAQLNSPRFLDVSPAEVYATLLDEGVYLASERTMYRLLAITDPSATGAISSPTRPTRGPSCSPRRPNELWSWDISKLLGPAK